MKKSYIKYLLSLFLFGSNGLVASRIALSSSEIVLLRTMFGTLLLLGIFVFSRKEFTFWKHKRQFAHLAVSGIATGLSWIFLYEAYNQIGVSTASLLYYCGPVIVMVLSPVLFKEHLTFVKVTGAFLVLIGIFLVNGHALQGGKLGFGLILGTLSAVMYAIMIIFNKKATSITGLENSLIQLTISFLTVALFVGLKQGYHIPVASSDWTPILILGLLNTGIGCYFYFSSIGSLPVQTVSTCGYLEPLSAVVFSVLFLNESMNLLQALGAILVIGGAIFSEFPLHIHIHREKRYLPG